MVFEKDTKIRNFINIASMLPAIFVAPLLSGALFESNFLIEALVIPVSAIISAAMLYDIAQRNPSHAHGYRHIASGILMLSLLLNMYLFMGVITALVCMATGLGLVVLGFQKQQRGVFISGVVLMVVGLAQQLYELVHHFDLGSWASLAALGVVSIVIASTIESQGVKIKPRIEAWKATFKKWEK